MAVKQNRPVLAGHTAGIYADMTLDGPEIGTLVAVIDRAKNLPNRRTMGKQDPYCAMRLGKEAKKTETDRRGGQTPKWDQELRFTVHESPDYYKLKCSIFNDDKKTDLIGEAWIDLSDLIKPGGGSNDLWHQLNYKGKYAGDVRIELTYYDLRPREERAVDRRRHKEKTQTTSSNASSATSTPRQLGPREVRRRPLPASPAATTPIETPSQPSPRELSPAVLPPRPPKVSLDQSLQGRSTLQHSHPDDSPNGRSQYTDGPSRPQLPIHHYRQPFCEDFSPSTDYVEEPEWDMAQDYRGLVFQHDLNSSPHSPSWVNENATRHRLNSSEGQFNHTLDHSNFHQIPPAVKMRGSSCSETSPPKASRYRDSPLRQSMAQQVMSLVEEPDSYDLPPPPPIHRETTPRRQQPDYPPSSFPQYDQPAVHALQPLHVTSRRTSIEDRSPLQQIEDNSERLFFSQNSAHPSVDNSPHKQYSYDSYNQNQVRLSQESPQSSQYLHEKHHSYDTYNCPNSSVPNLNLNAVRKSEGDASHAEPIYQHPAQQERSKSYEDRRSSGLPMQGDKYPTTMPYPESLASPSEITQYDVQDVRSRPRYTNPGQIPHRKAVSPAPHSQLDGRRLSVNPYGPDAYDILNPASSPSPDDTNRLEIDQGKESARMREVEKLREQGPIIGNDGRVIDPSDHLPSDTWAPEPERKNKRPEHVIHYRTKADTRSHGLPNSSPTPVRARYPRQAPNDPSPITTPPSNNRSRQQNTRVNRALPVQPCQQSQYGQDSSCFEERIMPQQPHPQNLLQRFSYYDNPGMIQRPPLAEYQVPSTNSYIPRGSSFQSNFSASPSKQQMQSGRDYNPRYSTSYDDDALLAEMSMIDIGPTRGGEIVLSGRRAY